MAEATTITLIGPEHHGTRMSLDEFARAEGRPGYLYELERGTVVVVDVPVLPHGRILGRIRDALAGYRMAHPGRIDYIAGGSDAALRLYGLQSERHPDLSVYLKPPETDDPQPWSDWVPDIAVEVVSSGGEERDYVTKREEYLRAGVRLYWIVDLREQIVVALQRRADTWRERRLTADAKLTTPLLPEFELPLSQLFSTQK